MKIVFDEQTGAQLRDRIMDLLGPDMVLQMLQLYWTPRGKTVTLLTTPNPNNTPYGKDNLVSGVGAPGEQGWLSGRMKPGHPVL